jgi:hypothetical protein
MNWQTLKWGLYALTSVAIFFAGYKVAEWRHNSARLQEVASALEEVEALRKLEQEQQIELFEQNLKWVDDLLQSKEHIRVVTRTNIKKVPVYVQDNRACDYSPDAVRLRNEVALGR